MTTPAEQVHDAFWQLPEGIRREMGRAMMGDADVFVSELGRALTSGRIMGHLLIDAALSNLRRDPDALALADSLGDGQPWAMVADAIRRTVHDPRDRTFIATDYQ